MWWTYCNEVCGQIYDGQIGDPFHRSGIPASIRGEIVHVFIHFCSCFLVLQLEEVSCLVKICQFRSFLRSFRLTKSMVLVILAVKAERVSMKSLSRSEYG